MEPLMRPKDYLELERSIYEMDHTHCMDCPCRSDSHCGFYNVKLEERDPGVYLPCGQCDDDNLEDDSFYPLKPIQILSNRLLYLVR